MEYCGPCKDMGRGQIVAHYAADKRRGVPAKCYYHHFNKPLPGLPGSEQSKESAENSRPVPAQAETLSGYTAESGDEGAAELRRGSPEKEVVAQAPSPVRKKKERAMDEVK